MGPVPIGDEGASAKKEVGLRSVSPPIIEAPVCDYAASGCLPIRSRRNQAGERWPCGPISQFSLQVRFKSIRARQRSSPVGTLISNPTRFGRFSCRHIASRMESASVRRCVALAMTASSWVAMTGTSTRDVVALARRAFALENWRRHRHHTHKSPCVDLSHGAPERPRASSW